MRSKEGLVLSGFWDFCLESRGPRLPPPSPGVILLASLGVCEAFGGPNSVLTRGRCLGDEPSNVSINTCGRFKVGTEGSGLCGEKDRSGLAEARSPERAELAQRGEGLALQRNCRAECGS